MNINKNFALFIFLIFSAQCLFAQSIKITEGDINNLIGNWEGSLTYLDYSSNQPFSMPCNAKISKARKKNQIKVSYEYPNEPKANSKFKMKFSKDGTKLGKARFTDKTTDKAGNTILIIEKSGKDGNKNKDALIKQSYTIGDQTFIVRKEVKFIGTDDWILRNEYQFSKSE